MGDPLGRIGSRQIGGQRTRFMDESKVREHLEEANQHVKKGEDLIEQQEERVQEMARDGVSNENPQTVFGNPSRSEGNV